jgi:hypothetical protein
MQEVSLEIRISTYGKTHNTKWNETGEAFFFWRVFCTMRDDTKDSATVKDEDEIFEM